MDLHLNGKRVLIITGGSRGIGLAAAESFAEEGCHVHLAARDKRKLEEAADRIRGQFGIQVVIHVVDLSLTSDVQRLANEAGEIDILINNAGDILAGSIVNVSDTLWRKSWDLKVFGYINLTRLIYARMKARGAGVIINDIGASGERPDFDYIVGSSANAALMALTKALGGRSLEDGVRVVGVNPGPVETDRTLSLMKGLAKSRFGDEARFTEFTERFPLKRAASPKEIGDAMVFFASDRSAYTSGVIYAINGGLCARGF